jgi:hypothetical protein
MSTSHRGRGRTSTDPAHVTERGQKVRVDLVRLQPNPLRKFEATAKKPDSHSQEPTKPAEPPAGSWRKPIAWWPTEWRQRWADRAEVLQAGGLPWDQAERQAFLEVVAEINTAEAVGARIDFQVPVETPDPVPFPEFDSLPGPIDEARAREAGGEWNATVKARPGNPGKEKAAKRWSGRPQWSAEDQEAKEAERERAGEQTPEGPDPQIAAFLEAARKKHEAYWAARPHGGREKRLF